MRGLVHEASSDEMDWKQTDRECARLIGDIQSDEHDDVEGGINMKFEADLFEQCIQTRSSREDSKLPTPCALWPVDLKLTYTDCNPGNTLVHFQGQYATICELDYNILQVEILNFPKTTVSVEVGDLCLVEDLLSSRWYRGRIQNKSGDMFDVFLLDHGNILTVSHDHLSAISDSLLMLPPKIVSGLFANVLPLDECWDQPSEAYFSSLIGRHIKGYIHGLLPYKVLILEVPEITKDLLKLSLGRHVDTDTFLLLVELTIEVPIQQSYESVPDLLIEKQIAQEISFKSSNLCGYENILSLSGSKLIVGQKERVRIAAAVNPGLFYCQLSSAAKDLKEMTEKLTFVCESRKDDFRDRPGENMGLLCAIKGKDEKWYRGLVQCLPVNSYVRVVFVDYGYCEPVKVENIFELPSDFLLIPIMTFTCSLSCLGDKDKATANHQLVLLSKGLLGKELLMTVDDLSKEKSVRSVTLSNVVECTPVKMVHSKGVDRMESRVIQTDMNQLSCISSETKKVSNNLVELLQEGSVFEGYVEHVQSPHDFWVRTEKSSNGFEAMMNKLTDWYSRLELNEEILQDPVPGQLCCAMYEKDMHYYRAVVVDILEYGAEVRFIDFGNTEKVPSMLIKKIPTEFSVEPEFALNCSLAHVVPLNMEDVWTATATDIFRKATSNKALLVHVIYKRSDVFVVELYEKGYGKRESITTLLTSANMAEYWTYSPIKTPGTPVGKNNKTSKTFARGQFAENSCKSMSQKHSSKVMSQESATDKQIHTETQKCSSLKSFKCLNFKPGAVISVLCSHVSSPSDFWCQNKTSKKDLDRLMERLQRFYQTNTSALQPHSVCCAVLFQLDNKWYRGCLLGGTALNVKVILVDYGIVVQEKLEKLQGLNPEFLELEGQAFRCSLCNLTDPVGGDVWSDEACTLLKDFTSENSCNLKCKVYSMFHVANKGLFNGVDLFSPLQRASTHLIKKGVAKEKPSIQLHPSVYPCSFVYSSFDVTVGSEELVFPTHVASPWEIYLQLDRNTEVIEQLMNRAMKESEELMSQMQTSKTDSVCLAKYSEDGKWYRSFVWPAQSSLHYNIFFVDYGGKGVAEKRNVLPIPLKAVDLLLTPMQALRCSLLRIPEEEHLPEINTWLEKATLSKGLRAKFVATNSSGHFICDLFDGDIHINEKVREIFAIHGQKDKSVIKPVSDGCKEVVTVSSIRAKGRYHVESVVKSQKTPGHSNAIQANGQFGQKKLSKLRFQPKSHNLNSSSAKKSEGKEKRSLQPTKRLQKEKPTIPCTSNVQSCKVLPKVSDLPAIKIAPGFRSVGFISHWDSADSFFIQMEKDEQNILKMRAELNSKPFTEGLQNVKVKVGDLVSATYDYDSALYRAVVDSVASNGYLKVEFVDYGNTATVDKRKMYPLASKFLSKARLGTRCTLSEKYNLEDVESLLSGTCDKPLMVEFVQNLGYAWKVRINPVHESRESELADETEDKCPDSSRTKQKQEMYADTSSIKKETKMLESGTNDSKVVQEKTLEKVQATSCMQKLRTNRKACAYKCKSDEKKNESHLRQKPEKRIGVAENKLLTVSNDSCGRSVDLLEISGADGQDISHSVVHQPTSKRNCPSPVAIPPERPTDKEDEIRRLFLAPVEKDHGYSGFVAAVTTPGEFYIILEDLLLVMNTLSNVLEQLPEDLPPLLEAHLIPGAGCLVKSEEKQKWCRAEIVQRDDVSVIIHLVDYGYFVHWPCQDVSKFKALPVELAGIPKITYPCLLRGIKPADELQWSDHAAVFFQQRMCQKDLKIHFRQYVSEAQWEVDVITSNRNVAKELVDAGHAHYIDNVLGIRFQQELDRKREIEANSVENVSEDASRKCERSQSKMEKVPRRYSEDVPSNDDDDDDVNDEDISQRWGVEGDTKYPFSGSPVKPGTARKTYGLQPRLSRCVSGLQ